MGSAELSPLQLLGHWVHGWHRSGVDRRPGHDPVGSAAEWRCGQIDRGITGAPADLLESAFINVEMRLRALADHPQSARVRASTRWLARWAARINQEHERQRVARETASVP